MEAKSSAKLLLKILIGAAWIDGTVQSEEREYIQKLAKERGLSDDREIYPFLYELVAVQPEQCYNWVQEYLGDSPTEEDYQRLIESISALIYSDGDVATEEAKLLTKLQFSDPAAAEQKSSDKPVLTAIQKLYRRWMDRQA